MSNPLPKSKVKKYTVHGKENKSGVHIFEISLNLIYEKEMGIKTTMRHIFYPSY